MNPRQRLRDLQNRNLVKYRIILWAHDGMSMHAISRYSSMYIKDVRRVLDNFNGHRGGEVNLGP